MPLIPLVGAPSDISSITASDLVDNELVISDDTDRTLWAFDDANDRLIHTQESIYLFGGNGFFNTSDPLAAIGDISQGTSNTGYYIVGPHLLTSWSYVRLDNDDADFQIMLGASTVIATIQGDSSLFEESASGLSTSISGNARLWVRCSTGSPNTMQPVSFVVGVRKVINL